MVGVFYAKANFIASEHKAALSKKHILFLGLIKRVILLVKCSEAITKRFKLYGTYW